MGKERDYHPLKLSEARALTPKPEGIGAYAEKLREAAYQAVTEADVGELMKAMMEKAKEGDVNAAKFVLGFVTTGKREGSNQPTVIVQQNAGQAPHSMRQAEIVEDIELENPCKRCHIYESAPGNKYCESCIKCMKVDAEETLKNANAAEKRVNGKAQV